MKSPTTIPPTFRSRNQYELKNKRGALAVDSISQSEREKFPSRPRPNPIPLNISPMTFKCILLAFVFFMITFCEIHAQLQPVELPQRHLEKITKLLRQQSCYDTNSQHDITLVFYVGVKDSSENVITRDSILWNIEYKFPGTFFRHDDFVSYSAYLSNEHGDVIAETCGSGMLCAYPSYLQSVISYSKKNDIDFIFFIYATSPHLYYVVKNDTVQAFISNRQGDYVPYHNPDFVIRKKNNYSYIVE